jgi:hypoxanthine phosphoribosyltransferase
MNLDPVSSPVHCLISAEELARRVGELAAQISADYTGKQPVVVGVLKGAFVFMADLVRQLSIPVQCDFVMVSSYGQAMQPSGPLKLRLDLSLPVAGHDLLLVEDIIDTGHTIPFLIEHLLKKKPASIRLCTLLDKPYRRQVPVRIDYCGFTVPDNFIVGYGIDCGEDYRELPWVGWVEE